MNDAAEDVSGVQGVLDAVSAVSAILSTMAQQLSATFAQLEHARRPGRAGDRVRGIGRLHRADGAARS